MCADGRLGCQAHAPYDVIHVSASSPEIPKPLLDQLKVGGVMIIPLGENLAPMGTMLTRVTKVNEKNEYDTEDIFTVSYPYLQDKDQEYPNTIF